MFNTIRVNRISLFVGSLCCLAFAIPFEQKLTEIFIVISVITWFSTTPLTTLTSLWKQRYPYIIFFISLYVINFIGLIHSDNMQVAFSRIESRLSYLIFPIIIFLSDLTISNIHRVLIMFSLGVATVSTFCLWISISIQLEAGTFPNIVGLTYNELLQPMGLHPYFHSILLGFSILYITHLILHLSKRPIITFALCFFLLYLFFLLLITQSRAPIVASMIAFTLQTFLHYFVIQRKRFIAIFILMLIGTVGLFAIKSKEQGRFAISTEKIQEAFFQPDSTLALSPQSMSTLFHFRSWYCAYQLLSDYHILTGYGSGDEKDVLIERYKEYHWEHMITEQHNAHNEYLSALLRNGIGEWCIITTLIALPLYWSLKKKKYFYCSFLVFWALAMIFSTMNRTSVIFSYGLLNSILFYISILHPQDEV